MKTELSTGNINTKNRDPYKKLAHNGNISQKIFSRAQDSPLSTADRLVVIILLGILLRRAQDGSDLVLEAQFPALPHVVEAAPLEQPEGVGGTAALEGLPQHLGFVLLDFLPESHPLWLSGEAPLETNENNN